MHYWISETPDDYTVQVGRGGEEEPFMSYTPEWGTEIATRWIGLGAGVDQRVKWQFCDFGKDTLLLCIGL